LASNIRYTDDPTLIRGESGVWFKDDELGNLVLNMRQTAEGTLRSVNGPAPYQQGVYGVMQGVFHARVGPRDILLAVVGGQVWVHQGWTRSWKVLLGPASSSPVLETTIPDDGRPRFPVQFESTPQGIIICFPGGRPYFYDGDTVAPLGYDRAPGTPQSMGPRSTAGQTQDQGYVHTGVNDDGAGGAGSWDGSFNPKEHHGMHPMFGSCRLGTVTRFAGHPGGSGNVNPLGGVRERGAWRAAVQLVDIWGNRSPRSAASGQVYCDYVENYSKEAFSTDRVDALRVQFAWGRITIGEPHTAGRVLLRTKDLLHSGTQMMFEVPANAAGGTSAFVTIPDNICDFYPDNTPDAWLLVEATDPVPMRSADMVTIYAGRAFYGNLNNRGRVGWSEVGLWGTVDKKNFTYPDPGADRCTGIHATSRGVLVFTERSTFLITIGDEGLNFRENLISARVGCVAPSSVQTLPSGAVVWLGHEGFYAWTGEGEPERVSYGIKTLTDRLNTGRMLQSVAAVDQMSEEYRCWVPVDGNDVPNLCITFDGTNWGRRTDMDEVTGVCVTKDHRRYMLAAGKAKELGNVSESGVWILDHEDPQWVPEPREAAIRTGWINSQRAFNEKSPVQVEVNLVETSDGRMTASLYTNWRDVAVTVSSGDNDYDVEARGWLHSTKDPPLFWGTAVYDGSEHDYRLDTDKEHTWQRRRPFWSRPLDVSGGDVETYMYEFRAVGDFEFIAMQSDAIMRSDGHGGRKGV